MWKPLFYFTFSHLWSIHFPARVTCPAPFIWNVCLVPTPVSELGCEGLYWESSNHWLAEAGLAVLQVAVRRGQEACHMLGLLHWGHWASRFFFSPPPHRLREQIILFHVQRLDWPMPLCRDCSCNLWPQYNYVIENTCWLTGCPQERANTAATTSFGICVD